MCDAKSSCVGTNPNGVDLPPNNYDFFLKVYSKRGYFSFLSEIIEEKLTYYLIKWDGQ